MNFLGRDCGCSKRKAESGISNPFRYWARRLLWKPATALLLLPERFTIAEGRLTARVTRADGRVEQYDLGANTITDAAVAYLVDDFDNGGQDISTMNFHAWGTGSCSTPACGATALVTEASESRVSGTRSQPAANQFRSVGEITAAGVKTITEWGLFSASSAGTAWSLRCFTGIVLAASDSIEFTYTVTFNCVSG